MFFFNFKTGLKKNEKNGFIRRQEHNRIIGNLNADIERAIGKHWWGKIRVVPISINFDYRLSITDYLGFRIYQLIEIIDSSLL